MAGAVTDTELVARIRSGDESAFALMYHRYSDGLHRFVLRQVRDPAAAEDLVQEVFVLVSRRIGQLSDPARLRAWLYAIAARTTYSHLRSRRFEASIDDAVQVADAAAGPEDAVAAGERLAVLLAATDGLSDDDRHVVKLFLGGLDGAELAAACGNSPARHHLRLHRAKKRLAASLGGLLVARHGRRDCDELDTMLAEWDGTLSLPLRRRIVRHVEQCDRCERTRQRLLRPEALLGLIVLCALPAAWRGEVVEELELTAAAHPPGGGPGGPAAAGGGAGPPGGRPGGLGGGPAPATGRPVRAGVAGAAALAVLVVLGVWSLTDREHPAADAPVRVAGGPAASGRPAAPAPPPAGATGTAGPVRPAGTPPVQDAREPTGIPAPTGTAVGSPTPSAGPTRARCVPVRPGGAGPVARQVGPTLVDDFESGSLAGFVTAGDVRVVPGVGPVRPPSCTGAMLLVGTGPPATEVPVASRPYVQASALAAPAAVPPGATGVLVRFRWNFLTAEYGGREDRADGGGFRDQFSIRFVDAVGGNVLELAGDRARSSRPFTPIGVTGRHLAEADDSVGQRGWRTVERTVPAAQLAPAAYLQIVAWDVGDANLTSAVLVDDLELRWT